MLIPVEFLIEDYTLWNCDSGTFHVDKKNRTSNFLLNVCLSNPHFYEFYLLKVIENSLVLPSRPLTDTIGLL